jgi:hypothetical protein
MRAIGRPFIGNSSIARKSSIAISAAFVFTSAVVVLLPTGASAQINIGGLIQGALQQRGYPYGYRAPSHSSSSSSHHDSDSDDDSAADNKNGKGIKSTNDGDSGTHGSGTGGGPQSASTDTPSKGGSSGGSGGGSGGGSSGGPAKTSDDMPSFAPSR